MIHSHYPIPPLPSEKTHPNFWSNSDCLASSLAPLRGYLWESDLVLGHPLRAIYVDIYIYTHCVNCLYPYVCMYVCMSVCLYACMPVCLYVCMSVCLYVCMSVCLSVCLPACMYVCVYIYIHIERNAIYIYIHMYINKHMYIDVNILP